jgi:hypothetical protein
MSRRTRPSQWDPQPPLITTLLNVPELQQASGHPVGWPDHDVHHLALMARRPPGVSANSVTKASAHDVAGALLTSVRRGRRLGWLRCRGPPTERHPLRRQQSLCRAPLAGLDGTRWR